MIDTYQIDLECVMTEMIDGAGETITTGMNIPVVLGMLGAKVVMVCSSTQLMPFTFTPFSSFPHTRLIPFQIVIPMAHLESIHGTTKPTGTPPSTEEETTRETGTWAMAPFHGVPLPLMTTVLPQMDTLPHLLHVYLVLSMRLLEFTHVRKQAVRVAQTKGELMNGEEEGTEKIYLHNL